MTATNLIKAKMVENGFSQTYCAEYIGISYQSFNNKLHNKTEFKASEIEKLCDLLDIKNKEIYFFASNIAKTAKT